MTTEENPLPSNLQELRARSASGEQFAFVFFWGHQVLQDGQATGSPGGSHVEPDADGHWCADLSPVGGPLLGPFVQRSEALQAERAWLEAHWLAGDVNYQGGTHTDLGSSIRPTDEGAPLVG